MTLHIASLSIAFDETTGRSAAGLDFWSTEMARSTQLAATDTAGRAGCAFAEVLAQAAARARPGDRLLLVVPGGEQELLGIARTRLAYGRRVAGILLALGERGVEVTALDTPAPNHSGLAHALVEARRALGLADHDGADPSPMHRAA